MQQNSEIKCYFRNNKKQLYFFPIEDKTRRKYLYTEQKKLG